MSPIHYIMDPSITSVVLVGVGGQGILLAAEILAQAALIAGHDVKTNEVHGMAQRGGSVMAQIRFGPKVFSPLVAEGTAKVVGSLERLEAIRYYRYLAPGGLAVVSSQIIMPVTVSSGLAKYPADCEDRLRRTFARLVYLDAANIAVSLGSIRAANTVLLGAISGELSLPKDAWQEALHKCINPKFLELNEKAFAAGTKYSSWDD
jgi:indolepyruvate ferredoxin oxidoreductase, beta subunit